MNPKIKLEQKTMMKIGNNISYIVHQDEHFLDMEYKVMQNQNDNIFVPCIRMKMNGKIQLIYLSEQYHCLGSILKMLNIEHAERIIYNMLKTIVEVKNNEFLNCINLQIDEENIFVDVNDLKVRLMYIPMSQSTYVNYADFDNKLRNLLINILQNFELQKKPKLFTLKRNLHDISLSIEDILIQLIGEESFGKDRKVNISEVLCISCFSDAGMVNFKIDKNEYYIGKNPNSVDGYIAFNPAISRQHCKIENRDGEYYLYDLNSVNGTFLNGEKVLSDTPVHIKHGDTISLANTDLQVRFGKE